MNNGKSIKNIRPTSVAIKQRENAPTKIIRNELMNILNRWFGKYIRLIKNSIHKYLQLLRSSLAKSSGFFILSTPITSKAINILWESFIYPKIILNRKKITKEIIIRKIPSL